MTFDLENHGPAISQIYDSGTFTRTLKYIRSLGGETGELHLGGFVTAVFRPHYPVDPGFSEIRFPAQQFTNKLVFRIAQTQT